MSAFAPPVRIAVIGTPRSGNTWLRYLLTATYDAPGFAVESPAKVAWETLPLACVLQIHWHPGERFRQLLSDHSVQVVAIARHPLDVLISILHYVVHHDTDHWLDGEGGGEQQIHGAWPVTAAFRQYATGSRAAALLSVSQEWWPLVDERRVRYEDLNQNAVGALRRLVQALGVPPRKSLTECVRLCSLAELRRQSESNHHFWQGKVGLWKRMLPATVADEIAAKHAQLFAELGYACDPDRDLDARQADAHWQAAVWGNLRERLLRLDQSERTVRILQAELATARELTAGLSPRSAAVVGRIASLCDRHPRARALLERAGQFLLRRAG
jgi:hypothetical protein